MAARTTTWVGIGAGSLGRSGLVALLAGALGAWLATGTGPVDTAHGASVTVQSPAGSNAAQDDPLVDPVLLARTKRIEALTTGLRGAWRLTRLVPASPGREPRQAAGLLLVDEHLLTIVVHAIPALPTPSDTGPVVQTGAHYWRIGPLETLETAAVIGHDNAEGALAIELQLEPREYRVTLLDKRLVLTKRDGGRLEFDRFEINSFPPQALRFIEAMRAGRNLDELRDR